MPPTKAELEHDLDWIIAESKALKSDLRQQAKTLNEWADSIDGGEWVKIKTADSRTNCTELHSRLYQLQRKMREWAVWMK
jgi:hypothetical protein